MCLVKRKNINDKLQYSRLSTCRHIPTVHKKTLHEYTQGVPNVIQNLNSQTLISINFVKYIQFTFLLLIYPILAMVQETILLNHITNLSLFWTLIFQKYINFLLTHPVCMVKLTLNWCKLSQIPTARRRWQRIPTGNGCYGGGYCANPVGFILDVTSSD